MKVRIQNDGGPGYMTQLTDVETGKHIENATGVEVHLVIDVENMPTAVITTYAPIVDVIADAQFKHVCPCCGTPTNAQSLTT